MSAKCLLQIICIQSIKETFELQLSWQKIRLSTLVITSLDVGGIVHPPVLRS